MWPLLKVRLLLRPKRNRPNCGWHARPDLAGRDSAPADGQIPLQPSGSMTRKSDAPGPLSAVQRVGTPSPTRCRTRPRRFCTSPSRHSQSGSIGIRPSAGAMARELTPNEVAAPGSAERILPSGL